MNLKDLQYLVTVADTRHFGEAAKRCFVSQPTLSMQLKKLEEELGVTCFERNNKQVMLTPVGETLVAQARRVLREADSLREQAKLASDPLAGRLRMGLIPTVAPYLLPKITNALHAALPRIAFELIEDKTENLLVQLRRGEIDVAVLATPVAGTQSLLELPLYVEEFWALLPPGHQLLQHKQLQMSDLQSEEILLLAEGHCLREHALQYCEMAGLNSRLDFQATSLETLRYMVYAGSGLTLLPDLAVTDEEKQSLARPFKKPVPGRQISLLYRETTSRLPVFDVIATTVIAALTSS